MFNFKVMFCLIVIIFIMNDNVCLGNENRPTRSKYIAASYFGMVGGTIILGGAFKLFDIEIENQGYSALSYLYTIMGLSSAIGSNIGTLIVSKNKMKVFLKNTAFTVVPMSIFYWLDDSNVSFGLYGLLIVPVFAAIFSYDVDKNEYYSINNNNASMVKELQQKFLPQWHKYTFLGEKINVFKLISFTINI